MSIMTSHQCRWCFKFNIWAFMCKTTDPYSIVTSTGTDDEVYSIRKGCVIMLVTTSLVIYAWALCGNWCPPMNRRMWLIVLIKGPSIKTWQGLLLARCIIGKMLSLSRCMIAKLLPIPICRRAKQYHRHDRLCMMHSHPLSSFINLRPFGWRFLSQITQSCLITDWSNIGRFALCDLKE